MRKIIPYGRQHIDEADVNAVINALKDDLITQGPRIPEFEENFAKYIGAKYAVANANGTAALHLSAMALGVGPGTKVLVSPITFAASSNCILYCGGEVDFVDINPSTGLMDIEALKTKLAAHPKGTYHGIVPVDFTGAAVNLEAFRKVADEYGLWILEDSCHSPGGYFIDSKGEKQNCGNGKFADCSIFSFHPVKHIAAGEGGMVTTNSKEIYDKLIQLRTHGITKRPDLLNENHGGWYYEMQMLGYNYRLTDFQAALANSQLKKAAKGVQRRRAIARKYDDAFDGTKVKNLGGIHQEGHAYHLYVIQVEDRKGLYDYLRADNIFAQVHYIPVHMQPYYKQLGFKKGDFPNAESYYENCLSLPMYPTLSDEEQDYVIEKVNEFCNNKSTKETQVTNFWKGEFGKKYTDRNTYIDFESWDKQYFDKYGLSRTKMFSDFIGDLDRDAKILEIGCNTGHQLLCLQQMGFKNLYGLELQSYAIEKAKESCHGINIIQGSGFDVPYKDGYFDLVMFNGVLITIHPKDLPSFMGEAYRCTSKYIMGFEYYEKEFQAINYRGEEGFLWKGDYEQIFQDNFSDLNKVKNEVYPYLRKGETGNKDAIFLLEKPEIRVSY